MSAKRRKHRNQHKKHSQAGGKPTASGSAVARPSRQQDASPNRKRTSIILLIALALISGVVIYALNNNAVLGPETASNSSSNTSPRLLVTTPPKPPPVTTIPTNAAAPKIQFATQVYDFGKINGGEVVKYSYVFTNVGGQTLQITNVKPSCGCTTAGEWSRSVEPSGTGSIPIEFNSGNFNGQVAKSITVTCNDPEQPTISLQIKGAIWRPIDVTPRYAVIRATSDSPSNAVTMRIVNNLDTPLTLSAPESNNRAFAAELKTNQPGREFELIVRTVPPLSVGNVNGSISLKTSSTNLPMLRIPAMAMVQPPVTVRPASITLPAAPIIKPLRSTVSIVNNNPSPLALSEPTVNAPGVEVSFREIQPGRYFAFTLTFPPGFEIAQGTTPELSVKSNHPRLSVIKVPITRPALVPLGMATPGNIR